MFLIIDTNILTLDYNFNSYQYKELKENSEKNEIKLFVSSVVFDEVVQKYKEKLIDFNKKSQEFSNFIPDNYLKEIPDENIEFLTDKYKESLEKNILNFNNNTSRFVNLSDIDFKSVYDKTLSSMEPFGVGENSRGFKDALIWEQLKWVISNCRNEDNRIAFITANIRDFCDLDYKTGNLWYLPTKSLRAEYIKENFDDDIIRVYPSLKSFIKDFIYREKNDFGEWIERLNSKANNKLFNYVFDEIKKENTFPTYSGGIGGYRYRVRKINNVKVTEAFELSDSDTNDEVIFSVSLEMLCEPIGINTKSFYTNGEAFVHANVKSEEFLLFESLSISQDFVMAISDRG